MVRERVLIIEDEEEIQELLAYNLAKEGYQVERASSGEEAFERIRRSSPDLLLLDLMLPGMDGLSLCQALKKDDQTSSIPLIMLTAKSEEADIVVGLEMGADDYITKPFSPRVLLARIKSVLRRNSPPPLDEPQGEKALTVHDLVIHPGRHEVIAEKEKIELTHTEFQILYFLAQRPGWVFTRNQILDAIRGEEYVATDRTVDVQIAGLRKKLGDRGKYIETLRGVGYRFKEEE